MAVRPLLRRSALRAEEGDHRRPRRARAAPGVRHQPRLGRVARRAEIEAGGGMMGAFDDGRHPDQPAAMAAEGAALKAMMAADPPLERGAELARAVAGEALQAVVAER